MNIKGAVVRLPGQQRGRRMTYEEADALLERGGFVRKVYERQVIHKNGSRETVICIWVNANYERAFTKTSYAL